MVELNSKAFMVPRTHSAALSFLEQNNSAILERKNLKRFIGSKRKDLIENPSSLKNDELLAPFAAALSSLPQHRRAPAIDSYLKILEHERVFHAAFAKSLQEAIIRDGDFL
ncbi:TPA: hypothetical protein HA244_03090 [Candidatus Micrarchaeota archaeon]|nr:hypothetical protein [Candidatus Micrarchaeota archaeon]